MNVDVVSPEFTRKAHNVLSETYVIKHVFNDSETWDLSCGDCTVEDKTMVTVYSAGWFDGYMQGVEENKPPF